MCGDKELFGITVCFYMALENMKGWPILVGQPFLFISGFPLLNAHEPLPRCSRVIFSMRRTGSAAPQRS